MTPDSRGPRTTRASTRLAAAETAPPSDLASLGGSSWIAADGTTSSSSLHAWIEQATAPDPSPHTRGLDPTTTGSEWSGRCRVRPLLRAGDRLNAIVVVDPAGSVVVVASQLDNDLPEGTLTGNAPRWRRSFCTSSRRSLGVRPGTRFDRRDGAGRRTIEEGVALSGGRHRRPEQWFPAGAVTRAQAFADQAMAARAGAAGDSRASAFPRVTSPDLVTPRPRSPSRPMRRESVARSWSPVRGDDLDTYAGLFDDDLDTGRRPSENSGGIVRRGRWSWAAEAPPSVTMMCQQTSGSSSAPLKVIQLLSSCCHEADLHDL